MFDGTTYSKLASAYFFNVFSYLLPRNTPAYQ